MSEDRNEIFEETSGAINHIETLLSGLLIFTGQYLRTIWFYLRLPLSMGQEKSDEQDTDILSPLSFVTVSILLFSLTYFRVFKELFNRKLISPESAPIIDHIVSYHDSVAQSTYALKFADAILLMIPLVLLVALFAKINEVISLLIRKPTTLEQQLTSCSYFLGTVMSMLALWSLPILYFIFEFAAKDTTSKFELVIGVIVGLLAVITTVVALYRHLQAGKLNFFNSWTVSFLVFVAALSIQLFAMKFVLRLFILGSG